MTLLTLVVFITVAVVGVAAHRKYWYACGLMDGAARMAEQQERDASLKSAARRLDAEWDRTHGRPT